MFSLDSVPSDIPFTTKSSLQALLKSRGVTAGSNTNKWIAMKDNNTATIPNGDNDLQNGDQNGDFSYSQKLFHIDDGNLYSIFSPLQGRSYGMKPSFLRKQKCTVQECHGRGRKIHRKGLKFHNFLPSQSITSEKEDSSNKNRWKVHSECKLREEHGIKQIMVSNWSQNMKQDNNPPTNEHSASDSVYNLDSPGQVDVHNGFDSSYNLQMQSEQDLPQTNNFSDRSASSESIVPYYSSIQSSVDSNSKYSFLDNLLHSATKAQSLSPNDSKNELCMSQCVQKRRRKPDQTRKVVPYTKYLSLMEEENESSPLDLSCREPKEQKKQKETSSDIQNSSFNKKFSPSNSKHCLNYDVQHAPNPKRIAVEIPQQQSTSSIHPHQQIHPNAPQFLYPFPPPHKPPPELLPISSVNFHHPLIPLERSSSSHKVRLSRQPSSLQCSSSSSMKSNSRRKSQRSVIKQKLEDTFRQNGFLVKTKQVSDGEATFCKFRQLRKYTRYYLKSWQQHLPDEVNKMWKGFLPPKTALPPVSSAMQNSVDGDDPIFS